MANHHGFTIDLLYCIGHGVVQISDLYETFQLLVQNGTIPYSFIFMIPAYVPWIQPIFHMMKVIVVKYRFSLFLTRPASLGFTTGPQQYFTSDMVKRQGPSLSRIHDGHSFSS